ncbi:MAG: hypothetical protein DME72_08025 [Verrucomicrobia bacterium]|nr:MAG: hypothetical protein DME72_08025 [Verrucomicrobiota bacterium]
MPVDLPETTSKMGGPLVKQFSVFLPNKVGAMLDIVKMLNTNNTHVVALSVSESTDSAIARIVVSDPERLRGSGGGNARGSHTTGETARGIVHGGG